MHMYKRKHTLEKKTDLHYSCKLLKPVLWNEELPQREAWTNWFQYFTYSIVALGAILRLQIDQNCYYLMFTIQQSEKGSIWLFSVIVTE